MQCCSHASQKLLASSRFSSVSMSSQIVAYFHTHSLAYDRIIAATIFYKLILIDVFIFIPKSLSRIEMLQFCKQFRVGEKCCEFECLDTPGENFKYEVRSFVTKLSNLSS